VGDEDEAETMRVRDEDEAETMRVRDEDEAEMMRVGDEDEAETMRRLPYQSQSSIQHLGKHREDCRIWHNKLILAFSEPLNRHEHIPRNTLACRLENMARLSRTSSITEFHSTSGQTSRRLSYLA
jgi:hypothetical protein